MPAPESDSHGGPTDTTGQKIDAPDNKKPRKQVSGKKKLKDLDEMDPEDAVDRSLFQKNSE